MNLVIINHYYDDFLKNSDELLEKYLTTVGCAEALAKKGTHVTFIHRFQENKKIKLNGVNYIFIKDRFKGMPRPWHLTLKISRIARGLNADIVHVHGLIFFTQIFILRLFLHKKTKIVVQHHAEKPKKGLLQIIQKICLKNVNCFLFSAKGIENHWLELKTISKKKNISYVMEGSAYFTRQNTYSSKLITKMEGKPVFLWIGNLDNNKDPMTILDGFNLIKKKHPYATIYMIYKEAPLLEIVKNKIKEHNLETNVFLLGPINYNKLIHYYSSSDYFVLGSHYESCGYALIESLACGVVPIVSNIPSFYIMTNNGTIGGVWETGNSNDFYRTALQVMEKKWENESKKAVDFFNTNLSFDAIASKLIKTYNDLLP